MDSHRVVIVGGGFGGLNVARELGREPRVSVTLVDRRNFHLFQPLLYQVATGALSPGDIAQPLRSILRRDANTTVLLGEAVALDAGGRRVILSDGGPIPYDTLVVATGARHSYFGHDDWAAYAPGLKSIDDAVGIRRRILIAFEAAEREADLERRREWMTFVVVGGGPTGWSSPARSARSRTTRSGATSAPSIHPTRGSSSSRPSTASCPPTRPTARRPPDASSSAWGWTSAPGPG